MHIKLLTVIFIGFSLLTNAQKFSNSPFSAYGIGEFGGLDHAIFSSMGNTSTALIDTTVLNFNNPSSYASLGKGQPLFSTGISARFSRFEDANNRANSKYIGFDHFAIGVPFAKVLGLAIGLKPFSRTGYEFYDKVTVGANTLKYIYKGSGGTHEVFGGFSANVFNIKHSRLVGDVQKVSYHKLGLGANIGYIFGSTVNERISYFDQDYLPNEKISGGIESKGYALKSIHVDFGMNYTWTINKDKSLILAATYTPTQKLTARENSFVAYSTNVYDSDAYNLLDTAVANKGYIMMPSAIGVGFSYVMRPKNTEQRSKIYQLTLTGEIKVLDWSNYQTRFNSISASENFANTTSLGAGVQFIPHYDYKDRSNNIGYLSRIRYRAGFHYATLPMVINNIQQHNMGITAGFGLPFAMQRSASSINFGLVVGNQGNGNATSINEKYVGINFGVTISPGTNDRWFRKFKID